MTRTPGPPPTAPGHYAAILARMLARLPQQRVPSGAQPLARLATDDPTDPALALLDAWATTADVLAFYQERIAAEGYLLSAEERFSLDQLAQMLTVQPAPGLAASATLAFTVETSPGQPDVIPIPAHTPVKSVPGPGEKPQTFETTADLLARPAWNILHVKWSGEYVLQTVTGHTQVLHIDGSQSGIKAGDRLMIHDDDSGVAFYPTVAAVAPDAAAGESGPATRVTLSAPLDPTHSDPLTAPDVVHFAKRAHLFGWNAPDPPADQRHYEGGVFVWDPVTSDWVHCQTGLPPTVSALAMGERALPGSDTPLLVLFAATLGSGIYRSTDRGQTWEPCNTGLPDKTVYSLHMDAKNRLYAGLDDGRIMYSLDWGARWSRFVDGKYFLINTDGTLTVQDESLPKYPVTAIFSRQDEGNTVSIYAGTDAGLYLTENTQPPNLGWTRDPSGLGPAAEAGIRALATRGDREYIVGTTAGSYSIQPGPGQSNLFNLLGDPLPTQALAWHAWGLLIGTERGLTMSDQLREGAPDHFKRLPRHDLRAFATLGADREELAVATAPGRPLDDDWPGFKPPGRGFIDLDAVYHQPGDTVLLLNGDTAQTYQITGHEHVQRSDFTLRGTVTRLYLPPRTIPHGFYGPHLRTTEVYLGAQSLALWAAYHPADEPLTGTQITLAGALPPLEPGRMLLVTGRNFGADDDPLSGETVVVEACHRPDSEPALTQVVLRAPGLRGAYDPASVTVYGNVVDAAHGSTVTDEVLHETAPGTYRLLHHPLAHDPAPTPTGAVPALSVRVDGIAWQRVASLHDQPPHARVYTVSTDADGRASVHFGDNVHGARPRSGTDAVTATYRTGRGRVGNVRAGSLTTLRQRPLGVGGVTNPLPASGGTDPEADSALRRRVPQAVGALGRVVSLGDIEHSTRAFAGIGQAQARRIWTDRGPVIHLTILGTDGAPVPPGSALYDGLWTMLHTAADTSHALHIASAQLVRFALGAHLFVDPAARADDAVTAARDTLRAHYGPATRAIGADVTASDIVTLLTGLPAIIAVQLRRLEPPGGGPAVPDMLRAAPARWDGDAIRPAELLVLDDLTLTTETA